VSSPFIIVGLGNPGAEYENTRHNVGYLVIEELIRRVAAKVKRGNGEYLCARAGRGNQDIVLVKPLTYMNNSGEAVAAALQDFGAPIDRLLVVVDDIALQLGRLRLRPGGSAGGHNGLGSIISTLDTTFFARLRCGIGTPEPPPGELLADFVLSSFAREEQQQVRSMIRRAGDAVMSLLESGVSRTMNMFNE
jgi:PTH1 family peptidyl-tRNA hydrolase